MSSSPPEPQRLLPGDLRAVACVALLALLLLAAVALSHLRPGAFKMLKLSLMLACTLALGGCANMSPGAGQVVLANLQGCERHYNGVVTAGLGAGFSGSVRIDCPAARPPDPGEQR